METVKYNLRLESGTTLYIRIPLEMMQMYSQIRDQYQPDEKAMMEAKKMFVQKYPEEADQYFPKKK
jgi:hypothetical protein